MQKMVFYGLQENNSTWDVNEEITVSDEDTNQLITDTNQFPIDEQELWNELYDNPEYTQEIRSAPRSPSPISLGELVHSDAYTNPDEVKF